VNLEHQLFKGASFKLADIHDNETTIGTIQSMAMVNKIWPVMLYNRPATLTSTVGGATIKSPAMRKRAVGDDYATHVMTGVDKLHAQGYTGEGIYIGLVDTGVDYNHPALGGGIGPGYKIVAGTDLVGDAYDGTNIPVPDSDPMDCYGHGTLVSGIIGADPNPFNFTGVAPNATLAMWKVLGCSGLVSNDILIQAVNMAYEAGVDLITSSIGGSSGWTESNLSGHIPCIPSLTFRRSMGCCCSTHHRERGALYHACRERRSERPFRHI
jgi:subtilisin family serine protease